MKKRIVAIILVSISIVLTLVWLIYSINKLVIILPYLGKYSDPILIKEQTEYLWRFIFAIISSLFIMFTLVSLLTLTFKDESKITLQLVKEKIAELKEKSKIRKIKKLNRQVEKAQKELDDISDHTTTK